MVETTIARNHNILIRQVDEIVEIVLLQQVEEILIAMKNNVLLHNIDDIVKVILLQQVEEIVKTFLTSISRKYYWNKIAKNSIILQQ
jgi:hypothetical protein